MWWTLRTPARPLTYHAVHRMFERVERTRPAATATLHALRHTAAYRMAEDPALPLTDVQFVLGHAQLTTTQLYLTPRKEDVIRRLLAHHAEQTRQAAERVPSRRRRPATGPRALDGAVRDGRPDDRRRTAETAYGRAGSRAASSARPAPATASAPAAVPQEDWPATRPGPRRRSGRWSPSPPFAPTGPTVAAGSHRTGLALLLDWLEDQPGPDLAGAVAGQRRRHRRRCAGGGSRRLAARPRSRSPLAAGRVLSAALRIAIGADLVRPSLRLAGRRRGCRHGALANVHGRLPRPGRDSPGCERLCDDRPERLGRRHRRRPLYRAALILAAKGGDPDRHHPRGRPGTARRRGREPAGHRPAARTCSTGRCTRWASSAHDAPATLRELRSRGQRTPEQLVDRYRLACRPVRDLLVDYLRERQPALDYTSLAALAYFLVGLFWADLERHHPGIDSLHLPPRSPTAWKQRLRTVRRPHAHRRTAGPSRSQVARINYRECLTPVRAFYLDLAQWARRRPGRWGPGWRPARSAARRSTGARTSGTARRAWTPAPGNGCPSCPSWSAAVDQRRKDDRTRCWTPPGSHPGRTAVHRRRADPGPLDPPRTPAGKVWAQDPATGKRRDLGREEDHAFWAWAAVEVLRATGIRVEELLELSATTAWSNTGCPPPANSCRCCRSPRPRPTPNGCWSSAPNWPTCSPRSSAGSAATTAPSRCVAAYDRRERVWSAPAPLLFQRRLGTEHRRDHAPAPSGPCSTAALDRTPA